MFILTVIALAPAVALLAWTEYQLREAREVEVRALALRYAQLASVQLDRIVGDIESMMRALGHAPGIDGFDSAACDAYLGKVAADTPQLAVLAALDDAGAARCASPRPVPVLSARNRDAIGAAMRDGHFVLGTLQSGLAGGHDVLPLALPLHDAAGKISGAIVAYLDLGWLGERIREQDLGIGGSLTIADRDGIIIAREPFPDRFVGTRIPVAFDRLINAAAPGTEAVMSQDGTRRMLGYFPVTVPPVGFYISAGISEVEAFHDIDDARRRNLAIMLLLGVATFSLAWVTGQRFIQRPVERLLACVEAWRRGDFSARTKMDPGAGELEAVGAAFDGLLDELSLRQADRERAEVQRQLLVDELSHRVKNTLALAQAIASQSLRGTGDLVAARENFQSRLRALADAHDVLTANSWEAADLRDVLERTLRPYRDAMPERFVVTGPELRLQPRAALAVALAVHELATNAVKYGALAAESGRILIDWEISEPGPDGRFRLNWSERGGPRVAAPARKGFGSRLIEGALAAELHGTVRLDFAPEGLTCQLTAPLSTVAAAFAEHDAAAVSV